MMNEFKLMNNKNNISNSPDSNIEKITGLITGVFFLLLTIALSCTWSILFVSFLANSPNIEYCRNLRAWDTALYIYGFINAGFILIILILNIVFKNNSSVLQSVSKMNSFKMCINSIAGPTFIIGISIVYFGLKNPEYCGDNLSTLNLVFLIIEYSLIGLVFLILFCVCCCACCCAAFSSGTKE